MSDYIYNPDTGELYHYGVKGMKWGHRKRPEYVESARANMRTARANKRAASKALNKSYDKAYNYSSTHMISQYTREKQKAESDRRWNDFNNKARESNKADAAYKQAKKDYKQAKKQASAEARGNYLNKAVEKGGEIAEYRKKTAAARESMSAGKKFIQKQKDNWNEPAMTITGKDTTRGRQTAETILMGAGAIAVSVLTDRMR